MARTTHTLETTDNLWMFKPDSDGVEVWSTARTGELGLQGRFTKQEARDLWVELRSDGALWEEKDCAET
tara:strand:- start:230 stop:436 length:207 start_codon:yes stop_codon:yes gene_type:complete